MHGGHFASERDKKNGRKLCKDCEYKGDDNPHTVLHTLLATRCNTSLTGILSSNCPSIHDVHDLCDVHGI